MPYLKYLGLFLMATLARHTSRAQSQEIQQLLLNVEKLTQFKAILSDMQRGYTILNEGYGQVKDLTQGNFSLHQVFLDGLLQVNPEIRKYARVADLLADQASILSEYKKAKSRFAGSGRFNAAELDYLTQVYAGLTKAALRNLNELADVVTASKLRMSDDERLRAIDRLYADTHDQLQFLRSFNRRTSLLQMQRQNEQNDIDHLKKLFQP
ncbi:TerB family tellurite resistance protein [Mucilaginibacter sp. PAMB04168]|uniref:TerB family tellurite resistance protein n=1 Tax=Mucilaginibacter sp. PAMB04168 TaxID=3138567 RepID=UPI0031F6F0DD